MVYKAPELIGYHTTLLTIPHSYKKKKKKKKMRQKTIEPKHIHVQ